ncbi:MAG: phosphoribosyltransferase family protein [Aquificaceae bacterium]|nr:phosphoribosyltransferase family protein [Aquificaceae bacterium]
MIALLQFLGLAECDCLSCGSTFRGREQGFICESCLQNLRPYHPLDYSTSLDYVSSYRVYGLYEGALREVIHSIKFNGVKSLAFRLGQIIKGHLWEYIEEVHPDIVTFPSLNLRRFWGRGFNHVECMLQGAELPYLKVFKRVDLKPPLARLRGKDREIAVSGHKLKEGFVDFLEGKRVLVVDDLLTTGSTIKRLAYLLLSVGAEEVHAYFVAKA